MNVPLEIRWPIRHGDFTATLRIPLGATSAELNTIRRDLEAMEREAAEAERRHSRDGRSALQRQQESWTLRPAEYLPIDPATKPDESAKLWRCIYCRQPLAEDEECTKPACVAELAARRARMGVRT